MDYEAQLDEYEAQIHGLEMEVSELRQEVHAMELEIDTLERQLDNAIHDYNELAEEHVVISDDLSEAEQDYDDIYRERNVLENIVRKAPGMLSRQERDAFAELVRREWANAGAY